jgi:hypothetical protein
MDFDWKKTLGALAPLLGTALGGPLGGVAASAIAAALGAKDTDDATLAAAVKGATPDQLLALKNADNQFKLDMAKLGLRPEELEVQDRISARGAYSATKDLMVPGLALLVVGTFCAVTVMVLLGYLKIEAVIAGTLIGYLSAKAEQVLAFYFGSSRGSKDKDAALADALTRKR